MAHRLAELAVARNVDADVFLLANDVDDGFLQRFLKGAFVSRRIGFAGRVGAQEIVGPRQAASLAGKDMVAAHAHGFTNLVGCLSRRERSPLGEKSTHLHAETAKAQANSDKYR